MILQKNMTTYHFVYNISGEARGLFLPLQKRVLISLCNNEGLNELFDTTEHESIHAAIDFLDIELEDEVEHYIINKMFWAKEL